MGGPAHYGGGSMKLGAAELIRGNALDLPLADDSVDLIITSPPYFALRSYQDEGQHYDGQIGSEETPEQFLEALWTVMAECWRGLKPTGSAFVNLGDKYTGSSTHGNNKACSGMRVKSLMAMPWRFAIGCIDGKAAPADQRWILRAEIVWSKPNGLPESVTDRVRRSHEQWFHFTKQGSYFAAVDEIREPQASIGRPQGHSNGRDHRVEDGNGASMLGHLDTLQLNPRGKLPGSVWTIPSEPL